MIRRDSALHFVFTAGVVTIIALFSVSCATQKDFIELRREMYEQNNNTESRLVSIEQSVAVLDSLIREQYKLSRSLRALLGTQSQEQRDNIELIAARQDDINYLLRELFQKLQAIQLYGGVETKPVADKSPTTPGAVSSTSASAATPAVLAAETVKVNPKELYDTALEDIRNERFQLAESRFLSFLMQFPKHELAGNAQYWLGEAVYSQGKYELAISEFEKVLKKYKKSPKVPAAMLKIGFSQLEQGKKKTAVNTLNRLIKSHPKSEEADLARERLNAP